MPWSPICKGWVKPPRVEAEMISGIITTILLLLFIGGWVWAWSPARKADFDEASKLPLEEGKENYP